MARRLRVGVNVALGAGAIATLGATALLTRRMNKVTEEQRGDKVKIYNAGVTLAGTLAWPLVWDMTVGYEKLTQEPWMIAGFLWPMVMNVVQLSTSTLRPHDTTHSVKIPFVGAAYADAAMTISTVFAMGTLLCISQKSKSPEVLKTYLMYALVLCIAFIVPTAHLNPNYATSATVRAFQRVLLNYAIGYVISAIVTFASKTVIAQRVRP